MEQAERVVPPDDQARRDLYLDMKRFETEEARRDEIRKRGLATKTTVLKYIGTNPETQYQDPHTDLCRCEKPASGTAKFIFLRSGMYVQSNEGDQLRTSRDYVAVSDREAELVPIVEDALLEIHHLVKIGSMQTKQASAAGDIQRTREMIDTLLLEEARLKEEERKAASDVAVAKDPLVAFLGQMPPAVAEATHALAAELAELRASLVRKVAPYNSYQPPTPGAFELPVRTVSE